MNQQVEELVFGADGVQEVTKKLEITLKLVHDQHPALFTEIPHYNFEQPDANDLRRNTVAQMIAIMDKFRAIGLAANQVNLNMRVFVMRRVEEYEKDGFKGRHRDALVCFNPAVIQTLEAPVAGREGCLSFPGLALQVARPNGILVQYENEDGALFEMELFGVDARCFQHELDHLKGIVFTEKIRQQWILSWELEKQRKLVKKARKEQRDMIKYQKLLEKATQ
jgi:peptide deformylase